MRGLRVFARLFGLVLIALALPDAAKLHIWTSIPSPVSYLSSAVLVVGGLALVLVHPRWTGDWPVLVAILGWLAMLGGLAWHATLLGSPAVVGALARFLAAPWFGGGGPKDALAQLAQIEVLLASGLVLIVAAYGVRRGGEQL
jgi:hypothetical protein